MSSFANFGPMYRRIKSCHIARDSNGWVEALTEVRAADSDIPKCALKCFPYNSRRLTSCITSLSDYRLHPAILDAAIHIMVHPMLTGNYDSDVYHLPSKISTVRFMHSGQLPAVVFGYTTLVDWTPGEFTLVSSCIRLILMACD